ncbi:MAG: DUF6475 domain-containing protein [Gallionella sp.]|nr:DUF6475 domain-containing protein [Gallionella sp.]
MVESDRKALFDLLANVYAFYRVDCTAFALGVWWEAMRPFDLASVKDALNRHAVNPDNGQFCPKPADVAKLIGGGTADAALVAWSKTERALRQVGTYETVVFDDPIIHAVLSDMGGWIQFGKVTEEELPFTRNNFVSRYRGYCLRGRIDQYPAKLIGIIDGENCGQYAEQTPKLIGNPERAAQVLRGGGEGSGLRVASDLVAQALLGSAA